jgi:anti-sigma regulatory factor (Ser/Thr protein kinase)
METSAVHEVRTAMDDVHLVIPASSEFLRTVRLVAADASARAGLDLAEIEDFRIAVDELSHAVMTATDHDLRLTFRTDKGTVVARGSARSRGSGRRPTLTELSRTIVSGVCDWFELADQRSEIVFVVVKRARRAMVERA